MAERNSEVNSEGKETQKKVSRRGFISSALAVVSLGAFGSSIYFGEKYLSEKKNSLKDLEGNSATFENGEIPTAEDLKKMNIEDDHSVELMKGTGEYDYTGGDHSAFWVPSVGLSAPLSTMSMVNGVINPPGFQRVYEVRNVGHPFSERERGTVYLTTHSLKNGKAPGNALIDVMSERASVSNGDSIFVRNVEYVIEDHFTIEKPKLKRSKKVWEIVPGRLVIVTCLQRPEGGRSLKNSIIFAQLKRMDPSDGGQ